MQFYNVTIIFDGKQEDRLHQLAAQYNKINGWKEEDLIQFAVNALPENKNFLLEFLDANLNSLKENEK